MAEKLNGHEIVFVYTDPDGMEWLHNSMDDAIQNHNIDGEDVVVRVLGDDCSVAYWANQRGDEAAYRAREMNAELPTDQREMLKLKGMI